MLTFQRKNLSFGWFRYIVWVLKSDWIVFFWYRRGLSKHYQGKSESFTSLASVKSLEDLSKRGASQRKKLKSCTPPKAIISKKVSRGSLLSSLAKRGGLFGGFRPSFHAQKEFLICKPREVWQLAYVLHTHWKKLCNLQWVLLFLFCFLVRKNGTRCSLWIFN